MAIVAIVAVVVASGCSPSDRPSPGPADSTPEPTTTVADPAARAAAAVARFTDEDLVGQVLMPFAYGNDATKVSAAVAAENRAYAGVSTPAEMVARYRLGGLILVGWSVNDPTASTNKTSNVESPGQVRSLTTGLHDAARRNAGGAPLLIGTDQEYGEVTRIGAGMVQLPSAMAFGAAARPDLTEAAWKAAGTELAALGINVDFAPVADVLDPSGGFIGSRSFGSDPRAVAAQVAAATRGLQSAGVAATLKHFPGHGHTTVDSHEALPALTRDRAALDRDDLPPFLAGRDAGAWLVMSGHLDVRAVDAGTPATFSSKVLIDLLRKNLGFTGVTVSDALNMAPARRWSPGEAAVRAIVAGNDLLLMPPDLAAAQRGLLDGLKSGQLPRARLVEAATRVLTLRYRLDGFTAPPMSIVDNPEHRTAARAAAAAAVTLLRGACTGALVRGPVSVTASAGLDGPRQSLTDALRAAGVGVGSGGAVVHLASGRDGVTPENASVTVAVNTPFVLGRTSSPVLLATYSSIPVAMQALAEVLAGKAPARGRSPVAVSRLPRSACAE